MLCDNFIPISTAPHTKRVVHADSTVLPSIVVEAEYIMDPVRIGNVMTLPVHTFCYNFL